MSKKPYTPEEIAIIREFYPIGGAVLCVKHMKGRTREGVSFRAQMMGIRAPSVGGSPPWTSAQVDILRKNYSKLGVIGTTKLLPGKTQYAVTSMAKRLGIRVQKATAYNLSLAVDSDEAVDSWPPRRVWVPVNEWKAEPVTAPRSVFEVAA